MSLGKSYFQNGEKRLKGDEEGRSKMDEKGNEGSIYTLLEDTRSAFLQRTRACLDVFNNKQ